MTNDLSIYGPNSRLECSSRLPRSWANTNSCVSHSEVHGCETRTRKPLLRFRTPNMHALNMETKIGRELSRYGPNSSIECSSRLPWSWRTRRTSNWHSTLPGCEIPAENRFAKSSRSRRRATVYFEHKRTMSPDDRVLIHSSLKRTSIFSTSRI